MARGKRRCAERERLEQDARREANWKRWGPYLAERQWGTVREDYSPDGSCWTYFPHEHARSRAYRWGEDGLLGFTDRECRLCFAVALWNGRDAILKERMFGLTPGEGNHGEDVKEDYFYIDATPTYSYCKSLYKYPQAAYPYRRLVDANRSRGKDQGEFELADTGAFDEGRYFDVFAEYAKGSPDDIAIRLSVANRGPQPAELDLLAVAWFRNTWSFGSPYEDWPRPGIRADGDGRLLAEHETLGRCVLLLGPAPGGAAPELLFTENDTNSERLFGRANPQPYVKDAFGEYVVGGRKEAVCPEGKGTKAAGRYHLRVDAGQTAVLRLRLFAADGGVEDEPLGDDFERTFRTRIAEADEFYGEVIPSGLPGEAAAVMRQAYAGLLFGRQFYYYVVRDWLAGDPKMPPPPPQRRSGRNSTWTHVFDRNTLAVPDKWEFPWFAAWDLGFQMLPLARVDPAYAKDQLVLLLREWYMHPDGQLPAYESSFSDVNPPVHAWACWRTYKIADRKGGRDRLFLQRAFDKLLLNFTWWVNRKDVRGRQIFSGGFLGMDNIGVFDRGALGDGRTLEQADGTAWMGFYCLTMLTMALELAEESPAYEDTASKFFHHFISISDAMNNLGGTGLWDEQDGFYYDVMLAGETQTRLRVRSLVGLIPLIAVAVLDDEYIGRFSGFMHRREWFLKYRSDLGGQVAYMECPKDKRHTRRLLAIPCRERLLRVLKYMLDENEFLSPYGIRSLSRWHRDHPFRLELDGRTHQIDYEPGESTTEMFGGNSNWRGPVWLPVNYLLVEALERYHHFYGETLKVECPTGSGAMMDLKEVAAEIQRRLTRLFLPDEKGEKPWYGRRTCFRDQPDWNYLTLFHEYYHGDSGKGLGASHQTGWTALIARLLADLCRRQRRQEG